MAEHFCREKTYQFFQSSARFADGVIPAGKCRFLASALKPHPLWGFAKLSVIDDMKK